MGWEVSAAIVVVMLSVIVGLVIQAKRAAKYKERDRANDAEDKQVEKLEDDFWRFRGSLGRNVRRKLRGQPKGDA